MDDLNGLDWSAASSAPKAPAATGNYYPTLRPTPPPQNSGRHTPLSAQGSGAFKSGPKSFAPPKPSTPDSFSNLVSFGAAKQGTLTLQQQQEKLQAEKRKQEEEKQKQYQAQFGHNQFWDGLGSRGQSQVATPPVQSRTTTPALQPTPTSSARVPSPAVSSVSNGGDEDLFAAFSADAPVDKSSYYTPPSASSSGRNTPGFVAKKPMDLSQPSAWEQSGTQSSLGGELGDDDDPFGLGQMKAAAPTPVPNSADDDDFLGDLAKPVEDVRRAPPKKEAGPAIRQDSEGESDAPWDKAVAELVDMGFSVEQSRRALTESGGGLDIQVAVGWILDEAHRQAKEKKQGGTTSRNGLSSNGDRREPSRDNSRREQTPAWMKEEGRDGSRSRREDNRSPNTEVDFSKQAAAVGSNLLKTANTFWKTSQKTVKKAVAEFQQEGPTDPSQPKWMREAAEREQAERRAAVSRGKQPQAAVPDVTDEALMLEGGGRPQRKLRATVPEQKTSHFDQPHDRPPSMPRPPPERASQSQSPRWQQSANAIPDSRARASKLAAEEQAAQAYISPARRKKATPQPRPEPEVDLFSAPCPAPKPSQPSRTVQRPSPPISKPSTPIPTRPKAPTRQIPSISPASLANSNQHRLAGTAHFKRGDYASAHQSYTSSISALPSSHPIVIILLCNRALTGLKTGEAKSTISDADTALQLIGVSRGDGESIDLGSGEGGGNKEMKEFYGKALMRKAEALEQMEQWKNAGDVWKICVEHGVGGSNAIQGRTRCEKALAPKPAPSRTATPRVTPKPKPQSALSDLGPRAGEKSAAVKRLREANQAADKADEEKFALSEKVEQRIGAWRDGKRDNLRALIGSLDNVMWEGAGWKKVGMHELVQNNKVKINYMKAIGKTHPDKLPQDASTEVKMIAALVFATLNESWDKFKQQNGM